MNIWQQTTNEYWPTTTALQVGVLPPGIYSWNKNLMGWFLVRNADRFEFPYKLYGHQDHIIGRIQTAWSKLEGNLGILLNGIKGTGKTITAQVVANWAVDSGLPVLVVRHSIPLSDVLERINQPVLVIFDEFEKTHDAEEQQALLTALDGMARNAHRRLFVFTTNEKNVDVNFVDRPSRIRYCWEFDRLSDALVDEIIADLLDPTLADLRPAVAAYLSTRKVLSIDVAKTVINEVNIFREDPEKFAEILNLTEQDARGFTVEVLDANHTPVRTLTSYFTPYKAEMNRLRAALTRSGRQKFIDDIAGHGLGFNDSFSEIQLEFQEATEVPSDWICHVRVPFFETWVRKFKKVEEAHYESNLWLDDKPEGWHPPAWATKMQNGEELTSEEQDEFADWRGQETVYGVEHPTNLLVRITPNYEIRSIRLGAFAAF